MRCTSSVTKLATVGARWRQLSSPIAAIDRRPGPPSWQSFPGATLPHQTRHSAEAFCPAASVKTIEKSRVLNTVMLASCEGKKGATAGGG